jgi:hypothetical protein
VVDKKVRISNDRVLIHQTEVDAHDKSVRPRGGRPVCFEQNGFRHSVDFTRLLPALHWRVTKGCENSKVTMIKNTLRETKGASRRSVRRRNEPNPRRSPTAAVILRAEPRRAGIGTLARTNLLILAAVRVWELRRGIRD